MATNLCRCDDVQGLVAQIRATSLLLPRNHVSGITLSLLEIEWLVPPLSHRSLSPISIARFVAASGLPEHSNGAARVWLGHARYALEGVDRKHSSRGARCIDRSPCRRRTYGTSTERARALEETVTVSRCQHLARIPEHGNRSSLGPSGPLTHNLSSLRVTLDIRCHGCAVREVGGCK